MEEILAPRGRTRRTHSAEFKARAVAACRQPGVSMAAVAMAHGINANLLRRWALAAHAQPSGRASPNLPAGFISVPLPARPAPSAESADIRIEFRRGATTVSMAWPAQAAGDCAAWLRDLIR